MFLFERAVGRRVHRGKPPFSGGLGCSGPVVTADTLVVDIAPEFAVVLGIWNDDLLAGLLHGGARQVQFGHVGVEQVDVGQDAVGVDDDAPHGRAVTVSGPQGAHAAPQTADEVVQFGEFGRASRARQRISSAVFRITVRPRYYPRHTPDVSPLSSDAEGANTDDGTNHAGRPGRRAAGTAPAGQPG